MILCQHIKDQIFVFRLIYFALYLPALFLYAAYTISTPDPYRYMLTIVDIRGI